MMVDNRAILLSSPLMVVLFTGFSDDFVWADFSQP